MNELPRPELFGPTRGVGRMLERIHTKPSSTSSPAYEFTSAAVNLLQNPDVQTDFQTNVRTSEPIPTKELGNTLSDRAKQLLATKQQRDILALTIMSQVPDLTSDDANKLRALVVHLDETVLTPKGIQLMSGEKGNMVTLIPQTVEFVLQSLERQDTEELLSHLNERIVRDANNKIDYTRSDIPFLTDKQQKTRYLDEVKKLQPETVALDHILSTEEYAVLARDSVRDIFPQIQDNEIPRIFSLLQYTARQAGFDLYDSVHHTQRVGSTLQILRREIEQLVGQPKRVAPLSGDIVTSVPVDARDTSRVASPPLREPRPEDLRVTRVVRAEPKKKQETRLGQLAVEVGTAQVGKYQLNEGFMTDFMGGFGVVKSPDFSVLIEKKQYSQEGESIIRAFEDNFTRAFDLTLSSEFRSEKNVRARSELFGRIDLVIFGALNSSSSHPDSPLTQLYAEMSKHTKLPENVLRKALNEYSELLAEDAKSIRADKKKFKPGKLSTQAKELGSVLQAFQGDSPRSFGVAEYLVRTARTKPTGALFGFMSAMNELATSPEARKNIGFSAIF